MYVATFASTGQSLNVALDIVSAGFVELVVVRAFVIAVVPMSSPLLLTSFPSGVCRRLCCMHPLQGYILLMQASLHYVRLFLGEIGAVGVTAVVYDQLRSDATESFFLALTCPCRCFSMCL